jgi:hypothetical protein
MKLRRIHGGETELFLPRPNLARLPWPDAYRFERDTGASKTIRRQGWAVCRGDLTRMLNYEIRYLTGDDKVALIYKTQRSGDRDAELAASVPMSRRYKIYEIWRGDECVRRGINPRLPN